MPRNVTDIPLDPRERYSLFRLCNCPTCEGKGKATYPMQLARWEVEYGETAALSGKCPDCRGEGRIRQELVSCETPEAVGVALVTLAREGEFEDCPFGLLDREGETGKRWLVLPYPATARTVSAAGRLLRSQQQ